MDIYTDLSNLQVYHRFEHSQKKTTFERKDVSCQYCYSTPTRISKPFRRFVEWYQQQFYGETYTNVTLQCFTELLEAPRLTLMEQNTHNKLEDLIRSFTYSDVPKYSLDTIKNVIILAFTFSEKFTIPNDEFQQKLRRHCKEQLEQEDTPEDKDVVVISNYYFVLR